MVDDITGKGGLKFHQSIQASRMMYGWINIGIQKNYMGQDDTCPCYGGTKEPNPNETNTTRLSSNS